MSILKSLLITYTVIYIIPCSAQVIKSKDGVALGDRKDFISTCTNGFDNEALNINGLEVETYKYCECVCDNLLPSIYSWEMVQAVKEDKLMDFFFKDENLEILMKCLGDNLNIEEDYKFSDSNNPDLQKKLSIKNCVKEMMSDEEYNDLLTEEIAEEYCACAINKLYSEGYTYKDILEVDDENSESFNEIVMPCLVEALKDNTQTQSPNSYKNSDIVGGGYRSLIPLIDYLGQGYKIKISLSGVTKYYLFDTGASDLIIDRDTERELLLNGVLKRESYLGKTEYTLANKTTIQAQKVIIDSITIGDYTVNNVVIAIIDEGSLLCGKSFLDKFKKWEIDKQNNLLILYK